MTSGEVDSSYEVKRSDDDQTIESETVHKAVLVAREAGPEARDYRRSVPIGPTMSKRWGEGTMVVPAPREVDGIMKSVPPGKLITINEIRAVLARHGATIGCPMTTGIFAWIAANAAEEDLEAERPDVTPYWRTLKAGGLLNEKYPGGVTAQKAKLEAEGHQSSQRRQALRRGELRERPGDPKNRPTMSAPIELRAAGFRRSSRPDLGKHVPVQAYVAGAPSASRSVRWHRHAMNRHRRQRSPDPIRLAERLAKAKAASLAGRRQTTPRSSAATSY